jgi:predicted nucleotidyltransferase
MSALTAFDQRLLERAVDSIREIEPSARLILFGSRARGEAREDSDWDVLVLLEGALAANRVAAVRRRLYEIEWETGYLLSVIVRSSRDWNSSLTKATPFYRNVEREGVEVCPTAARG